MSRHELPARRRPPRPYRGLALQIAIGWDRPLSTFFANVVTCIDEADGSLMPILLVSHTATTRDPRDVVRTVHPYARVPHDMVTILAQDAAREGSRRQDATTIAFDVAQILAHDPRTKRQRLRDQISGMRLGTTYAHEYLR